MSVVGELEAALAHYPLLLTVEESAGVLRISRAHAYELARRYEASDGKEGIPVLRVGSCVRVPRWALAELLGTGQVVRLRDAVDRERVVDRDPEPRPLKRRRTQQSRVVRIDRDASDTERLAEQLALLPTD